MSSDSDELKALTGEPGLLDTAEGRAISDAADEANAEGEAYQEELQRLRDAERAFMAAALEGALT